MRDVIETERLVLRGFSEDDIEPLHRIQSDPIAMKYTVCIPSIEGTEKRFKAYAALEKQTGFSPWTILLRNDPKIIGWGELGVDPFDPGWGVEVVYFFHPGQWGKGFGTELVGEALKQGFGKFDLTEINAFAHPQNAASIRVLEKNGFQFMAFRPTLNRNHYRLYRKDRPRPLPGKNPPDGRQP